jgi:hypothetical protein
MENCEEQDQVAHEDSRTQAGSPVKIETWEEFDQVCEFLGITLYECVVAATSTISEEDEHETS